ncbi:secretory lipase-domain-containing protein [Aspergillus carlsbadensis]|nr:secretory lipase-domain-containing protein [Aspergillus carlsbadensis]
MWALGFLLALAGLIPAASTQPTTIPEDPSTDPFYKPPTGFEFREPGTILRQRKIRAAFFGLIPDPVDAYQLLYRTTAVNGSAIATVTTVFKPRYPYTDRFVSFHTEYDSSSVDCNPSYQYRLGAFQTGIIPSVELPITQAYLLKGYIVASPDYEGPDAAFGAARLAGMGVLDGMRAVARFRELNFTTRRPAIVGTGYSGGAIATGWAAALHRTYAPELNIRGWAQGGTPSNLTGTLLWLDNSLYSGFLPAAIDGLLKPSAYGLDLQPFIDSIVTNAGQLLLDYANSHCTVPVLINFHNQSIFDPTFQILGPDFIHEPIVSSIMEESTLGVDPDETPIAPVYAYHAALDDIIPYGDAEAMVDRWCSNGANVSFTTFATGGHIATELFGMVGAVRWVERAFEGNVGSGCSRDINLADTLHLDSLGQGLEPVMRALGNVLDVVGGID